MSIQEISPSKNVKANKDHRCNYCNGHILKGVMYETQTLKYEGIIYTWKNHIRCHKIAQELNMYDHADEGVTDEFFCESIKIEFTEIWQKTNLEHYESKEFVIPKFQDQLDFVCKHYNI